MKANINRASLAEAFGIVSAIVPTRSPKPILQNVKLTIYGDGSASLQATDLEIAIRYRIDGVKVDDPGSVILPTRQFGPLLRTSDDVEIALETDDSGLIVTGEGSSYSFPSEDPDLFPEMIDGDDSGAWVIVA